MKSAKILDPNRLQSDLIPSPTLEETKRNIERTIGFVDNLNRELNRFKQTSTTPYLIDFIIRGLSTNLDLLISCTHIPHKYPNSHLILMRTFTETLIDFFWVFSKFKENSKFGEELAKRQEQCAAYDFVKISSRLKDVLKHDQYLRQAKSLDFDQKVKKSKEMKLIDLVDLSESNPTLKGKQRTNWRALPGLIKDLKELEFNSRAKIAAGLILDVSNLKAAPFVDNWSILNQFAHPSAFYYLSIEDNSGLLYLRHLGIMLGHVHDMINVGYQIINLPIPQDIQLIRVSRMYWFST